MTHPISTVVDGDAKAKATLSLSLYLSYGGGERRRYDDTSGATRSATGRSVAWMLSTLSRMAPVFAVTSQMKQTMSGAALTWMTMRLSKNAMVERMDAPSTLRACDADDATQVASRLWLSSSVVSTSA
eukprot:CAMPEP_0118883380 /NCGR_PEP_ID=MMETSP1163-20130328/22461_1 /TAXON_ID=124430 /ORGANISM="Phaeomonas parva, Strain CCMP2877" /LENGTH=127 /DNA_ID=CAMNT_0006820769 /DNA_START=86 /DNA_END=468 /DNA_ORIENTATION=-